MHLTPHEIDKVMLHQVGVIAQKRLARGLRLNYPEAVALISTQLLRIHPRRTQRREPHGPGPKISRPSGRHGRRPRR